MKRKAIIILVSIMSLSFNLTGCTDEKTDLNQYIVITDDVKSDTEPELKVISTETIYFDKTIYASSLNFIEKADGSILVEDVNYTENYDNRMSIKINGNEATSEYIGSINDEYENIQKTFYLKNLDDNRNLIIDWRTDNRFEVEKDLINNEQSRYDIAEEYLIELVNGSAINKLANDSIAWTNLKTGSGGEIKMPEELRIILQSNVVEDKLFLAAISNSAIEALNEELGAEDSYMYTYFNAKPDTLLVIDLTINKLIEKSTIGSFECFHPIDDERIIFISNKENEKFIEMYNLNNKTRKELMKYSTIPGEGLITLNGLEVFPSKDKIYYCEDDGEKVSLKIAEINGMDIDNVITAYEGNKSDLEDFCISDICISSDEREIKIFNTNLLDVVYAVDKIIKIKLSK